MKFNLLIKNNPLIRKAFALTAIVIGLKPDLISFFISFKIVGTDKLYGFFFLMCYFDFFSNGL